MISPDMNLLFSPKRTQSVRKTWGLYWGSEHSRLIFAVYLGFMFAQFPSRQEMILSFLTARNVSFGKHVKTKGAKSGVYTKRYTLKYYRWIESSAFKCLNNVALDQISKTTNWRDLHSITSWQKNVYFSCSRKLTEIKAENCLFNVPWDCIWFWVNNIEILLLTSQKHESIMISIIIRKWDASRVNETLLEVKVTSQRNRAMRTFMIE